MELVIEIKNKGSFPRYQRFNQALIQIGRGYANDVILADPYVCASHMSLEYSENGWLIKDCGDKNPVIFKDEKKPAHNHRVQFGDEFLVGKTQLRVLSTNSPVEPVHAIIELGNTLKAFTSVTGVISLALGLLALVVWQNYNSNAFEFGFEQSLGKNIFVLLVPTVWAGVWAVLGRVMHHDSRFVAHAAVAILALVGFFVEDQLSQYLGYFFSSKLVLDLVGFSITGLLIAWLINKNLSYATELKKRTRLFTSHLFAWLFIGIVLLINFSSSYGGYALNPTYMAALKSPVLNVFVSGVEEAEFFDQVDALFDHDIAIDVEQP